MPVRFSVPSLLSECDDFFQFSFRECTTLFKVKGKGKAVPLQAWIGPVLVCALYWCAFVGYLYIYGKFFCAAVPVFI